MEIQMKNTNISKYRINDLVTTSHTGYFVVKEIRWAEHEGFTYLLKKVFAANGNPLKNSKCEFWAYENWVVPAEQQINQILDNYRNIYDTYYKVLEDEGFFSHE